MAKKTITMFVLLFLIALSCIEEEVSALRGLVGGRTKIKDVRTNKEVQELGRYCVDVYNKSQKEQEKSKRMEDLMFYQVVSAERQVVSGIKYYLKISATCHGLSRTFDAVVVVKPWDNSKVLVNFSPSRTFDAVEVVKPRNNFEALFNFSAFHATQ